MMNEGLFHCFCDGFHLAYSTGYPADSEINLKQKDDE